MSDNRTTGATGADAGASRVALVSGGSRGIGRAAVLRLARDGFDVSFCYQSNTAMAEAVRKELADLPVRTLAVRTDVSDADAVRAWVSRTERELGPIDVVVTCAGITRDKPLMMMGDDDWHQVLDTNLDGCYHVNRAVVVPMMKRKSGSIINVSSVSGVYGNPTQANYSASKAGIIGFSKALAKEVGRFGVRVNVVAPGLIDTDMTDALSDQARGDLLRAIPLRRFGHVEEVADFISYLSSSAASYITGSVLEIHGGITI
ncbi:3-oxoacyl-ACP reductase [Streptomyces hygroscopicus]|uniref:3-oxoacyl-[acyl-carrier-protein] reductase n=1 Tax=Streptomyces hygroscopicus TaxID=1912 RepID=UPI00223EA886|nr:3-oxoacyl-[acyl-carrier-protein] reductase [Streptomyces hygroscopicus]MCW7944015.1 3-oxoacyl-ACP reductase [Streptomyces hygroscopicus]